LFFSCLTVDAILLHEKGCAWEEISPKSVCLYPPVFLFSKILYGKTFPLECTLAFASFRPTSVSNMAECKQQRRSKGAWEWLKNLEDRRPRGANLRRSLGISITHSSCKPQGWLNRFFPHLLSKAGKILAAKEQDRNFRAMRRYKFLVLLAGEVVLLHLCSMSRELCYTLLAKISKYGCQGLLSDTKPTRPKIDALLSGPVYLRTNHAMQGVQLLFFCF